MPLLPLAGHQVARTRVAAALRGGRLPQTILVSGDTGVGKQRFALWVAQLLLCATGRDAGAEEPCGTCPACRKVLNLAHPDLHWLIPIPRPKAGDPDKAVDEAAEAVGEMVAERRGQPLWTPPDGMASHGVASARLVLRRAALTAAENGPKVFIVGDAERLVSQESSPEAANALLKVIEEPPRNTWFLLTAADPARLLPTIRSRAVPLRLGRLADTEVRDFLSTHLNPAPKGRALDARVASASGAIGQALAASESAEKAQAAADQVLEAVLKGGPDPLERALRQIPWHARGDFSDMLTVLADTLSHAARAGEGRGPAPQGPAGAIRAGTRELVTAVERVEAAREAARGNVNPQLLLTVLSGELREVLCP